MGGASNRGRVGWEALHWKVWLWEIFSGLASSGSAITHLSLLIDYTTSCCWKLQLMGQRKPYYHLQFHCGYYHILALLNSGCAGCFSSCSNVMGKAPPIHWPTRKWGVNLPFLGIPWTPEALLLEVPFIWHYGRKTIPMGRAGRRHRVLPTATTNFDPDDSLPLLSFLLNEGKECHGSR
jgi:hypothetical protein